MWRRPDNRRDSRDAYTAKVRNLGTQGFSLARYIWQGFRRVVSTCIVY